MHTSMKYLLAAAGVATASAFTAPMAGSAQLAARGKAVSAARPQQARAAARARGPIMMASRQVFHGGKMIDLMVKDEAEKKKVAEATDFSMQLNERQLCDVELIVNGGLSPLTGPMKQDAYEKVVNDMRREISRSCKKLTV